MVWNPVYTYIKNMKNKYTKKIYTFLNKFKKIKKYGYIV